jgi:prepilin-type N-terminal cleavage/methylation domain-containing protein
MRRRKEEGKKSGFTLVEIIAVLVILAILTAVAVPRYFDLAATAKQKALDSAMAEGMAVCNLAYAKESMKAAGVPALANVVASATASPIGGDFTVTFAASGAAAIQVTASGKAGTSVAGVTTNKLWNMP